MRFANIRKATIHKLFRRWTPEALRGFRQVFRQCPRERDGHSASGKFAIPERTCSLGTKVFSTIHMSNLPCFRTSLNASRTYADPSIERLKSNASVPFNVRAINGRFI